MDHAAFAGNAAASAPQHQRRGLRRDPYAPASSAASSPASATVASPSASRRSPYGVGAPSSSHVASSPARTAAGSLRRPRPASSSPGHGHGQGGNATSDSGSLPGHSQRVPGHFAHSSTRPTRGSAYPTNAGRIRGGDGDGLGPGGLGAAAPGLLPSVHRHPLFVPQPIDEDDGKARGEQQAGSLKSGRAGRSHGRLRKNGLNSPQLDLAALLALLERGREVLESVLGAKSSRKRRSRDPTKLGNYESILKLVVYALPVLFLLFKGAPPVLDRATKPPKWDWKPSRHLNGRRCAMNLFVEKQAHDEYDPDHQLIKPGEKNKDGTPKLPQPPKIVEGTYRTKGQMHVLERFIEAVADSFRSDTKIRQHVIFAGARDGGHAAGVAQKHWPPRGSHRAQFHVVADDTTDDDSEAALGYGTLDAIERKFKGDVNVHVYGRDGMAGVEGDDDEAESLDFGDDDGGLNFKPQSVNASALPYPDLRAMIPTEDEEDAEVVVPYLHVDGLSHDRQFEILESARPLLDDNTVRAVGMERSPDLNIPKLIEFFRSVGYKTFFLGSRQIYRVDHLCEEILEEVLAYPKLNRGSVHDDEGHPVRHLLQRMRVLDDPLKHYRSLPKETRVTYAPFVVALPLGRRTTDGTHLGRQEMTIQHMYDLFGGYGGGGQIKTANDRKAPGKK